MTVPTNILDNLDDGRCWVCGKQCIAMITACTCCEICIEVQEEIGVED